MYEHQLLLSNTSEVLKVSEKVLNVSETADAIAADVKMFNVASPYSSIHDICESE